MRVPDIHLGNWQKIKYQPDNHEANADSATLSSTYQMRLQRDRQSVVDEFLGVTLAISLGPQF